MTAFTGTVNKVREQKNIIDIDKYDRYEIVSSSDNVVGHVYVPKDTTVVATDTITLTVA